MSTYPESPALAEQPHQPLEFDEPSRFWEIVDRAKQVIGRSALALALATGLVAVDAAADARPAVADTGGYPDWNKPCVDGTHDGQTQGTGYWCDGYQWGNSPSQQNSSRGYGYRNCTDWAAWRIPALAGVTIPWGWGNAKNWDNAAAAAGYAVDTAPEPGDIAVWEDGPFGHVAVVESTNPLVVSEYNGGQDGNYRTRTNPTGIDHFIDLNGPNTPAPPSSVFRPLAADFNGDGLADIALRNADNGMFYIKHGPSFGDQITYQWAPGSHYQPFAADFNGDGYADLGLRDPSNGVFYIKNGPNFGSNQTTYQWATGYQHEPIAGDFFGDGTANIGLRNANNGMFYIKHGPDFVYQNTYQWAPGSHYRPFVADFNGDGLADIGLRDSSNGTFYMKNGPTFGNQNTYQWAAAGSDYQPFAADFHGDGTANIGMRSISNGTFYMRHGPAYVYQTTYPWAAG